MKLLIYGSGGSGRELFDMIDSEPRLSARWEDLAFIDDTKPAGTCRDHLMFPLDEAPEGFSPEEAEVSIAVGEPAARKLLAERVQERGYRLADIIHPDAIISKYATVGNGVIIKAGAVVSCDSVVGDNVWIQSNAVVAHDARVGNHCQISYSAVIAGRTVLEDCVFLGLMCCLRDKITIGEGSVVAMGAMVMRDVRPGMVVMGNPAREVSTTASVF